MTLFESVFQFFKDYVFYEEGNTNLELIDEFFTITNSNGSLGLLNYLCLISSIITMVAIVLFCVFIIKKIIGIIFRLFTGSSAF